MGSDKLSHWFKIKGQDYLNVESEGRCVIMMVKSPEIKGQKGKWILGDIFLRAYDSIYDIENLRLGLAGPAVTVRNEHSVPNVTRAPKNYDVLIAVLAIILFFVILVAIYVFRT